MVFWIGGAAIDTAEITAICHGDTKIRDGPAEFVRKRHCLFACPAGCLASPHSENKKAQFAHLELGSIADATKDVPRLFPFPNGRRGRFQPDPSPCNLAAPAAPWDFSPVGRAGRRIRFYCTLARVRWQRELPRGRGIDRAATYPRSPEIERERGSGHLTCR